MRSFLYDSLTTRDRVHGHATHNLEDLPKPEKVVRLEDLTQVIELYHHLIGTGKFDEARYLYEARLSSPIYFQLYNYNLKIEFLKAMFPNGEGQPRLKKEAAQAWTLNSLANSYALSGQPAAVPLF